MSETPAIEQAMVGLARELCGIEQPTSEDLAVFLKRHGVLGRQPVSAGHVRTAEETDYILRTAGFAMASACNFAKLSTGLEKMGVPCLVLKGFAWSKLLYGNLVSRPFGDLDVLVPFDQLPRVEAYLIDRGFQLGYPTGLSSGQAYAWRQFGKAQNFYRPVDRLSLDLHWRLFSQWIGLEVSFSDLWQRRVLLDIPDLPPIATFGAEDSLVFTALHGSQDGWSTLKSLLDLALFLQQHPPCWQKTATISGYRLPLVRQAITFAVYLLGAPNPNGCQLLYADRASTLAAFLRTHQQPEPPQLSLLSPQLWSGSKLGMSAKALKAILTPAVDDLQCVELPPRLASLYIVIRFFRLIRKLTQRRQLK